MELKRKLKDIPHEPGVYLIKGAKGVLYVGKAKDLRARLGHYFSAESPRDEAPKTQILVQEATDFEVMLVHNEVEALLLERTLIKHHKPPYNINLQDDKQYPYLRIDVATKWPRFNKVRKTKDDKAVYLGPFVNVGQLNIGLGMMYRIFPLIRCSEHEFRNATRPCNYYHMKQCLGPCTMPVDPVVYKGIVDDAIAFLQGKNRKVIVALRRKMSDAAKDENYELAATFRDQIEAFNSILQTQVVIIDKDVSCDIVGVYNEDSRVAFQIAMVRAGKLVGSQSYTSNFTVQTLGEAVVELLLQYYDRFEPPKEILLPFAIESSTQLLELLKQTYQKTVRTAVPVRGVRKRMLDLAMKNAKYALEIDLKKTIVYQSALDILQVKAGLNESPRHIECVDISNVQGTAIVGSVVRFKDGKPDKTRYRLFNIADQALHADDFTCIHEVITRRLRRGIDEEDLPNLIVIDGGPGQLNAALEAARQFPDLTLPIISLAKSRLIQASDEVAHSSERIFLPHNDIPIELDVGSPEYRLLTHMRDEAHNFAIKQHRRRRKIVLQGSVLDGIKGIGPVLRKRLLTHFFDVDALRRASVDELIAVKGMTPESARAVKSELDS